MMNRSATVYMAFKLKRSALNGIAIINIFITVWKFWLATYFQKVKEQMPSVKVPETLN